MNIKIKITNGKPVIHQPVDFNMFDDKKTTLEKRMKELERKLELGKLSKEQKAELEEIKTQLQALDGPTKIENSIIEKLNQNTELTASMDKVHNALSIFNVHQEE